MPRMALNMTRLNVRSLVRQPLLVLNGFCQAGFGSGEHPLESRVVADWVEIRVRFHPAQRLEVNLLQHGLEEI